MNHLNTVFYILRIVATILVTLLFLRVLFVLTNRMPGIVVALSAISLLVFGFAFFKGGIEAIGIRSRKWSALLAIASIMLLAISTFILLNVQ